MVVFGKSLQRRERRAEQVTRQVHLRGLRVLLAEDNEINQEIALEILGTEGIHVTVANHGHEAIVQMQAGEFDLVLMDMQMPVMDGVAATLEIRKNPRWKDVPIIAMTANVMASDIERCKAAGMQDHIGKPIDVKDLFDKLARWVPPKPQPELVRTDRQDSARPGAAIPGALPASMPGIDLVAGVRNMAGNGLLYRKLLLMFRNTQADAPQRITDAIRAGDFDAAMRHAHTLRGVAGNIGASELQAAAGQLELALKHGDHGAEDKLTLVSSLLSRVVDAIEPLEARQSIAAGRDRRGSQAARDGERVSASLPDLTRMLDDYDSGAGDLIESLLDDVVDPELVVLLRGLEAAVRDFDFGAAKRQVGRLAVLAIRSDMSAN